MGSGCSSSSADVYPSSAAVKSVNTSTPGSISTNAPPPTKINALPATAAPMKHDPASQFAIGDYCLTEIDGDRVPCRIVALVRADDDANPESNHNQTKPEQLNQAVCGYFVLMCEDGINGVRFFVEPHQCSHITPYPIGCHVLVIIPQVSNNNYPLSVDVEDVNVQFDGFGPDIQPGKILDCSNGVYSVQLPDLPTTLSVQPWQIIRP